MVVKNIFSYEKILNLAPTFMTSGIAIAEIKNESFKNAILKIGSIALTFLFQNRLNNQLKKHFKINSSGQVMACVMDMAFISGIYSLKNKITQGTLLVATLLTSEVARSRVHKRGVDGILLGATFGVVGGYLWSKSYEWQFYS